MDYIDAFRRSVRCHGDETAIITEDGPSVTYGALDDRSTRLATALDERIPGQRCAVLAANGIVALDAMIAGQKRGLATVQLPFRAGVTELESMLAAADAGGLVFDDASANLARSVLDRTDIDCALRVGNPPTERAVDDYERTIESAPTDDATPVGEEYGVFYTSGTTGDPKAVLFDQERMWYGSTQVVMEMSIEQTDRALVTTPWYHMVTTDAWILPHLQAGASLVLQREFDPHQSLALIEEHDITGLLAVPTQLTAMIDAQIEVGYDIDSLSYIRTGGSVVTSELVDRASKHLCEGVHNSYGLTEGGPNLAHAHPTAQDDHTGTIGKESFMWNVRVVEAAPPEAVPDPEAVVDAGETGEIIARGPGMAEGYLDDPEAEATLFAGDGDDRWLRTGDVAEIDEDGYLYIVDRIDNMIVSGGENVYPQEVELALEDHPGVREAVVFGQPDDTWGEVICSIVSMTDDLTSTALEEFCEGNDDLANFKRPRQYAFVHDNLPRTDTGTLKREEAIDRYFE